MLVSPLVRQLIRSLKREPAEWKRLSRSLVRQDGVEVQFIPPYERKVSYPRLIAPRDVPFSGLEAFFLRRAIRRWLHRPL